MKLNSQNLLINLKRNYFYIFYFTFFYLYIKFMIFFIIFFSQKALIIVQLTKWWIIEVFFFWDLLYVNLDMIGRITRYVVPRIWTLNSWSTKSYRPGSNRFILLSNLAIEVAILPRQLFSKSLHHLPPPPPTSIPNTWHLPSAKEKPSIQISL